MQKVTKIKKLLISNSFFKFWKYQFLVRSFNKKIKPYKIFREILNVGDVVFALCFSPEEKKFYLIKQFRPFYFVRNKTLKYEIVGGLVDKGESLITALKREIKEEIGVKTKKVVKLTTYCPVPGYSDEIVHVYYAEVEKIKLKTLYNRNENEEIKIFKLNVTELKKINESKSIQNVLTKISIYEYFKKFKKS
jgi:ADP-ribose pyrophosphatase